MRNTVLTYDPVKDWMEQLVQQTSIIVHHLHINYSSPDRNICHIRAIMFVRTQTMIQVMSR